MAYVPKTWNDGRLGATPITAADLNHIEQGIVAAVATPAGGSDGQVLVKSGSAVAWGVAGGGGSTLTPTATKTSAYTAAVGDLAMMNVASGATTLTLPSAPANRAQVGYRAIGATSTVPLTINRGGSDTIGTTGATSASVVLADETVILQYDAPNTRWLGVAAVRTQASLDGRYPLVADTLALASLDRAGIAARTKLAGQAVIDYSDGPLTVIDWSTLPSSNAGVQVQGNRLYCTAAAQNPSEVIVPLALPAGTRARVTTIIQFKGGAGSSANVGVGFDTSASNAAPIASTPNGFGVIMQGVSNAIVGFAGSAMTGLGTPPTPTFSGVDGAFYEVTLTADEAAFSIALRPVGSSSSWQWTVKRSLLTAAGKTVNNVFFFDQDARALTGHSIGPVTATLSAQPSRTKTVAGSVVEGQTHKDVGTVSAGTSAGDPWRVSIPASYDPRRPAPVVLVYHQAALGTTATDRPWLTAKDLTITQALNDAGFIVAAALDGSTTSSVDRWGNQASLDNYLDLYTYVRSHYATGAVCLWALSMGGTPALTMLARRQLPQVVAFAGISNAVDLDAMHANATFTSTIDAAYGVDGTHPYATQTAGYNPMARNGWEFRGVPMRFYVASDDTVVPPTAHAIPFAAKVAPYAPEAQVVTTATGGHLATAEYQPSDLVSFFQRYTQ